MTDTAETRQAPGQPIEQPPMDIRILVVPLRIYLDGEYQGMEWRIHVQGPPKPGGDAPGFGHVRPDWHTARAYSAAEREGAIAFWLDTFDTPSFSVTVKHAKARCVNRWTP